MSFGDLTTSHAVAIERLSLVMLPPPESAMWQETAIRVLDALGDALREREAAPAGGG